MLTFILLVCLSGLWLAFLRIIWHWWWVNYRPYLVYFIADGRRT